MPAWNTLITVDDLATHIDNCIVVDCRHVLTDSAAGQAAYAAGHIPGAFFMHQDHDLALHGDGSTGRHPLPDPASLATKLGNLGLTPGKQLVTYDDQGGAQAGRLWWLARWLGHAEVAVLDGGLPAWQQAGFPVTTEIPAAVASAETWTAATPPATPSVGVDDLVTNLLGKQWQVVDARASARFNGETEPVDPVAGHIPGAVNRPMQLNLRPDGRFKPAEVIRQEFEQLLNGRPADQVVHSCGSGVTACHNLLAMEFAGLTGSSLYPGSWSEWCADPNRPVGTNL
jgi:thiosulfate/3-mercaptopyruvate sulfurtransferase